MSSFGLGYKCLKSLCSQGTALDWWRAKLVPEMFKPGEDKVFEYVQSHVQKFHDLPKIETLVQAFPDVQQIQAPENCAYYVHHLENRLYYEWINHANINSQQLLKDNPGAITEAKQVLQDALAKITTHQYRLRLVNVVKDAPAMVVQAYHDVLVNDSIGSFGWPHMDSTCGGLYPGDVVSIIGRPAAGKTWLVLYKALHNWRFKRKPLVVSMEMAPLPVVQRLTAMHAGTNIAQLKLGGYSTTTYKKFSQSLLTLAGSHQDFWVVDGNLAASVDDIYTMAQQLKCDQVYIDGAYLLKHPNKRLDRYTRVAENIELIKQRTTEIGVPTTASYQFARSAKKDKKDQQAGLEDIAFSDGIGQVSSIVLGLFQDESVETIEGRVVRVLKGRSGEVGQFKINWDFNVMNFQQQLEDQQQDHTPLEYI